MGRPREEASAVQPPIRERCCWPRQEEGTQHAAPGQVRVDSCGAVCAAARRSAVAAAGYPLFYPSSLSHSPTAGLRELLVCGRTTATLPVLVGVMMIGQCVRINTCAT